VILGPYILIHSGNHLFSDLEITIREQEHEHAPVDIEDNVLIAEGML